MSSELIKHKKILQYSSIWMDTVRNGLFGLTNTNRLVRFYRGCTGLKTGSTSKAGFCISATAKRGNMQLIAVIMGADTRDTRNQAARELLDFGFANYGLYSEDEKALEESKLLGGKTGKVMLYSSEFSCVLPKLEIKNVEIEYQIPESLTAPIKSGDVVGKVKYTLNGEILGEASIFVKEEVPKIKFGDVFALILENIFFS
jgi:D-alanyl-D-alanine carboxypeptidase (penicillin-binding protein 5/6)